MHTCRLKPFLKFAIVVFALGGVMSAQEDQNPTHVRSKISVYDLATKKVTVVYTEDKLWEAPNWSMDGKYLLANSGGSLFRIPVGQQMGRHRPGSAGTTTGVVPERVALDASYECNNDHGISPDGKWLAISAGKGHPKGSQVFVAGINGSNPKLVTPDAPSYFHGWSPDGKWLAFVGERGGHFNIFRIAATGGQEERLTSAPAYDDGPDYSPDGKWIYINSDRSGGWDVWRFPADGAGAGDTRAQRVTSDELEDWFPHPSPDGKWLVYLSFPSKTEGHNVKTTIQLRMMPMPSSSDNLQAGKAEVLVKFFGGQGTINVNSWSPDSKKFAFVSYELLK